jgi:hypothetical protein
VAALLAALLVEVLLAPGVVAAVADEDELVESRVREGNLRQRRYRFDKVSQWLLSTITKEAATKSQKKK